MSDFSLCTEQLGLNFEIASKKFLLEAKKNIIKHEQINMRLVAISKFKSTRIWSWEESRNCERNIEDRGSRRGF